MNKNFKTPKSKNKPTTNRKPWIHVSKKKAFLSTIYIKHSSSIQQQKGHLKCLPVITPKCTPFQFPWLISWAFAKAFTELKHSTQVSFGKQINLTALFKFLQPFFQGFRKFSTFLMDDQINCASFPAQQYISFIVAAHFYDNFLSVDSAKRRNCCSFVRAQKLMKTSAQRKL